MIGDTVKHSYRPSRRGRVAFRGENLGQARHQAMPLSAQAATRPSTTKKPRVLYGGLRHLGVSDEWLGEEVVRLKRYEIPGEA